MLVVRLRNWLERLGNITNSVNITFIYYWVVLYFVRNSRNASKITDHIFKHYEKYFKNHVKLQADYLMKRYDEEICYKADFGKKIFTMYKENLLSTLEEFHESLVCG